MAEPKFETAVSIGTGLMGPTTAAVFAVGGLQTTILSGNRLQMALVREAVNIVQGGIADASDVDLAAKLTFGLRLPVLGILEQQDLIGVDLSLAVLDYVAPSLNNEPGAPSLMQEMVQRGELGMKSGKGFNVWSTQDVQTLRERRDQFLAADLRGQF